VAVAVRKGVGGAGKDPTEEGRSGSG
jgi:hypothetical protein